MTPSRRGLLLGSLAAGIALLAGQRPARANHPILVGFAQDTLSNDWRVAQVRQFQDALRALPGVELLVTNARGDTAQQVRDIEDLARQKVRLLVTSPRDGRAMTPAIARVMDQGIPVLLLTRRVLGERYTAFVGHDDAGIGQRAGQFLARQLGGKGRVLVLQGVPTVTTTVQRDQGFQRGIADFPGITLAERKTANFLRPDAIKAMEEVLAAKTPFDAIFSHSDSMLSGARMALRKHGIDPRMVPQVGIDYIGEARAALLAGEQTASFTYPTLADYAAHLASDLLHGKPIPRETIATSTLVTRENAGSVRAIF